MRNLIVSQLFNTIFIIIVIIISSVNSQSSASSSNSLKMQTEIMKLNRKFGWLTDQIESLKLNTTSVSSNHTELSNQLSLLLNRCNQRNDDLQKEMDILEERIGKLEDNEEAWNKSITLTKPYVYSRYFDEYYNRTPTYVWDVSIAKVSVANVTFNLTDQPFRAQALLNITSTDVIISLAYVTLGNESTTLDLKLIPAVFYTCVDRKNDTIVAKANYEFGTVFEHGDFNYEEQLIETGRVLNHTLTINIYVEPPLVIRQSYAYDGRLTWAVRDYEEKRLLEQSDAVQFQESPYFYTGVTGYRMQALLRLNGYGAFKKKGLTVTMRFLTGPYDDKLTKSFHHNTTITLLHPKDPAKHLARNVTSDLKEEFLYHIDMATHTEIQGFLGDDSTLYYQIQVIPA